MLEHATCITGHALTSNLQHDAQRHKQVASPQVEIDPQIPRDVQAHGQVPLSSRQPLIGSRWSHRSAARTLPVLCPMDSAWPRPLKLIARFAWGTNLAPGVESAFFFSFNAEPVKDPGHSSTKLFNSGSDTTTEETVAVKRQVLPSTSAISELCWYKALSQAWHPNVVHLLDHLVSKDVVGTCLYSTVQYMV